MSVCDNGMHYFSDCGSGSVPWAPVIDVLMWCEGWLDATVWRSVPARATAGLPTLIKARGTLCASSPLHCTSLPPPFSLRVGERQNKGRTEMERERQEGNESWSVTKENWSDQTRREHKLFFPAVHYPIESSVAPWTDHPLAMAACWGQMRGLAQRQCHRRKECLERGGGGTFTKHHWPCHATRIKWDKWTGSSFVTAHQAVLFLLCLDSRSFKHITHFPRSKGKTWWPFMLSWNWRLSQFIDKIKLWFVLS